jgi:large exoprotein involved in heme utilization and adhesion
MALTDGAKITVETSGSGNAGDATLNVSSFTLESGARIDSSTSGAGRGGTITFNAPTGTLTIDGAGMFSDATASGPGGDINVAAGQVSLNTATVSATSTGTAAATAGNINMVFGSALEMVNSNITTNALLADGGNIAISASGSLLHLSNSGITTSVQSGTGSGGNITLGSEANPLTHIVLDGSQVRADAFGGPGGNINVFADIFLTQNSVLSASSALAAPGTIAVQAQVTDVSGTLAQLPESIVEAAALLRASCTARLAEGKASSLVVAGREGVPPAPDGWLWSPLVDFSSAAHSHIGVPAVGLTNAYPIVVPRSRCEG